MDERTPQTEQQRRAQQLKMEQLRRQQILLQQENKNRRQVEQQLGAEVASVMKRERKEIKPEPTAGEGLHKTAMKELPKEVLPEETGDAEDQNKDQSREEKWEQLGKTGQWFQTFCWMHIPVFGFFYMLILSLREKTPEEKKAFARAYVLYRVLVMILACTLLYVLYKVGLNFVDQMLSYVGD